MRYLTIILCVYMALLTVFPCSDGDFDTTISGPSLTSGHSNEGKGCKEICTPFCTCSCCSVVRTLTSHQKSISAVVQPVVKVYGESPVPDTLDQTLSIWQPPQIG